VSCLVGLWDCHVGRLWEQSSPVALPVEAARLLLWSVIAHLFVVVTIPPNPKFRRRMELKRVYPVSTSTLWA
jgi:hypothetical protein